MGILGPRKGLDWREGNVYECPDRGRDERQTEGKTEHTMTPRRRIRSRGDGAADKFPGTKYFEERNDEGVERSNLSIVKGRRILGKCAAGGHTDDKADRQNRLRDGQMRRTAR